MTQRKKKIEEIRPKSPNLGKNLLLDTKILLEPMQGEKQQW